MTFASTRHGLGSHGAFGAAGLGLLVVALGARLAEAQEKPAAKTEYKQEYRHSFVGGKGKDWERMGPDADACVKFEAAGLRIVLPTGHADKRVDTGVVRGLPVQGDFEITLIYEILRGPEGEGKGLDGTRVGMTAGLDRPDNNMANLSHVVGAKSDRRSAWMAVWVDPATRQPRDKAKAAPAASRAGRLRLVRTGAELAFLAADDDETEFNQIEKLPFGREPLQFVSIGASTCGDKASLEARILGIQVRAESIPGVATAPPADSPPPETPGFITRRKGADAAVPAWAFAAGGAALVVVGAWLFLRGRRRPEEPAAVPTAASPAPATLATPPAPSAAPPAFLTAPCPGCGKTVRARSEHAGKKVKCPACGKAVPLPQAVSSPAAGEGERRSR